MKKLYAPWRHDYVTKPGKKDKSLNKDTCVFCQQFAEHNDEQYFIIRRFKHSAVIMNYYPYNVGHVMILPFEHRGNLTDLTPEVRAEMMEVTNLAIKVVGSVLNTEGFNIGINQGVAGGGGIPGHLHIHVLPRWLGDTNFLETIGQTKLISSDFTQTYKNLKSQFDQENL